MDFALRYTPRRNKTDREELLKHIDRVKKMVTGEHLVTVLSVSIPILGWDAAADRRDHMRICLMSG